MNLIYKILGHTTQDGPIEKKKEPKSRKELQILSYRKYKRRKAKRSETTEKNPTKLLLGTKSKKNRAMVLPQGLKTLERNAKVAQGENPETKVSPTI